MGGLDIYPVHPYIGGNVVDEILASELHLKIAAAEGWHRGQLISQELNLFIREKEDNVYLNSSYDNYNEEKRVETIASIRDNMTGNYRKWRITLDFKTTPIFILQYNKREILRSNKFSNIYTAMINMNKELYDKYLASKKNAAQNKGDIRYIIASAIREEGLKRNIKFDSALTGEEAYRIAFNIWVQTLYYGRQELYVRIEFDQESNVEIRLGRGPVYKVSLADPSFDPDKLVTLVFYLVDDVVRTEEKSYENQKQHFSDVIGNWFKEKVS
jgi:hypothetical protein